MRTNSRKSIHSLSVISSAISLLLLSSPSYAEGHVERVSREQCAGIVKAGLNDCASAEHA